MRNVIIGGLSLVVLSLTVVWLVAKNRRRIMPGPIKVDCLGVREVVDFFKRPESMESLKASPEKIAVAIRDKQDDGRTLITLAVFDKATAKVDKALALYSVKDVDAELQNLFGGRDMLVIK